MGGANHRSSIRATHIANLSIIGSNPDPPSSKGTSHSFDDVSRFSSFSIKLLRTVSLKLSYDSLDLNRSFIKGAPWLSSPVNPT